mmetsp:Transcript_3946/g.8225  ORF Transcript_3946/g.8225 Transcript_3946/m.8225 type:complete len:101 (+) Transcript_3946:183-485(+)
MLHAHARANNISALEACLDANPSQVDLQDADGNTPLLAAVQTNSKRSIKKRPRGDSRRGESQRPDGPTLLLRARPPRARRVPHKQGCGLLALERRGPHVL